MTLTQADSMEDTVAPEAVEADPVKALLGADRDGLLAYHGFVSGGRYEVTITGRNRVLGVAEAVDVVERLRAIDRVSTAAGGGGLSDLRVDGTYVVDVNGRLVELTAGRVVDWSEGFLAAHAGQGQDHAGVDQLAAIAELLDRPSRNDQCRMVLLGLMHGYGEANRVSAEKLAELIGRLPDVPKAPAKKTVVDALGFGGYFAEDMAEKMIAALGRRWKVGIEGAVCEPVDADEAVEVVPEMPGLAALRRIVKASQAGWLRYVDEPAPNKARWKPERDRWYRLTVGEQEYVIGADGLDAWLDGVEQFHAGCG